MQRASRAWERNGRIERREKFPTMAPGRYHWLSAPVEEVSRMQAMQGDLPARAALHATGLFRCARSASECRIPSYRAIARMPARNRHADRPQDLGKGATGTSPRHRLPCLALRVDAVSQLLQRHVGLVVTEPLLSMKSAAATSGRDRISLPPCTRSARRLVDMRANPTC
jgi:hypothetical protein